MGRGKEKVGTKWVWEDAQTLVEITLLRRDDFGNERWTWKIVDKTQAKEKTGWDGNRERLTQMAKTMLWLERPDKPELTLRKIEP